MLRRLRRLVTPKNALKAGGAGVMVGFMMTMGAGPTAPPVAQAPEGSAQLWVDDDGGTCTRSAGGASYVDAAACTSLDAAWDAATAGDTIRIVAATYGSQNVTGDKASETTIIGTTGVVLGTLTTAGDNLTLEDVTVDAADAHGQTAGWNAPADNITLSNVDIIGDYVAVSIEGANVTWENGSLGEDGVTGLERDACGVDGQPVWIQNSTNVRLSNIRFNPYDVTSNSSCNHFETIRVETLTDGLIVENSYFPDNAGATTGHVFITRPGDGTDPVNVTIRNTSFGSPGGSYTVAIHNSIGAAACDTYVWAYNKFSAEFQVQSPCTNTTNMKWIGNVSAKPNGACWGDYTGNVWQHNIDRSGCGTDTWVNGAAFSVSELEFDVDGIHIEDDSPAVDAGETPGASDYCTGALGSIDIDGDVRPSGAVCDAGPDER